MPSQPYVYVIICTYNAASTLEESIESVLAQDYENFHLLIVDDGSQDNTSDILAKYKLRENITCIYKDNSGLGDSRNQAIRIANKQSAAYVAFCDADDVWLPQKLSMQMAVCCDHNADVVVTDMILHHETPPVISADAAVTHLEDIFKTLCTESFTFQPVTSVIRTSLFETVAEFTTDKSGQDFYPFLSFAFSGAAFYKVEAKLYRERCLEGSLQRSPDSAFKSGRARREAVLKLKQQHENAAEMTAENRKLLDHAADKYTGWMMAGARRYLPYGAQMQQALDVFPQYHHFGAGCMMLGKSVLYPIFGK